jgi:hypothetical protein
MGRCGNFSREARREAGGIHETLVIVSAWKVDEERRKMKDERGGRSMSFLGKAGGTNGMRGVENREKRIGQDPEAGISHNICLLSATEAGEQVKKRRGI